MKYRIRLLFILIALAVFLFSCELAFNVRKPDIYVLSWGNSYAGSKVEYFLDYNGEKTEFHLGKVRELKSTVNDADRVADSFENLATKANYNCYVTKLLCQTGSEKVGKYDNFLSALSEIDKKIKDSDILICYFSGHGGDIKDIPSVTSGRGYIAFSDILVDFEQIKDDIDSLDGTKVIIADTCRSGYLINDENGVSINPDVSTANPFDFLFKSRVNESENIFSLAACTKIQESLDGGSNSNSLFTTSLLKALGYSSSGVGTIGALANNKLTLAQIAKYVYEDTNANTGRPLSEKGQTPVFSGRSDDIILFEF